ncbi:MAG: excinuclease ABC subunit UvrA [Bdellovibrionota bacterium]|nr:excinuclease ABC subunit UvrA [Bdellovibrionota bacterium]
MDSHIRLKGVKQNNLKNFDLDIELGSFTVVCGPSGSGKSSLAFETLYAEGQRRYIDSLSNYTKQFLNKAPKPDLESIDNIPPAIALEQKNQVRNSRSTVGTTTELNDYLRIFFAKVGRAFCPFGHGKILSEDSGKALARLLKENTGERGYIVFRVDEKKRSLSEKELLKSLIKDGYQRYIEKFTEGERPEVLDLSPSSTLPKKDFWILIDRLAVDEKDSGRIQDSIRNAYSASLKYNLFLGGRFSFLDTNAKENKFSDELACSTCEYALPPVTEALFNFSSPVGACNNCNGFGNVLELDIDKIVPNPKLSISKGAIYPFTMPSASRQKAKLNAFCKDEGIDTKSPWRELPTETKELVLNGRGKFKGVYGLFSNLEEKRYKMHVRIFLARFKSPSKCQVCGGARLVPEAQHVYIGGKNFKNLQEMSFGDLQDFFNRLKITPTDEELAAEVLRQIKSRLSYLNEVGLHYLTPIRETRTLSGGEYQRIKLANQLGMELSQTLYVLDEPTIGLHPRDNERLIGILKKLNEQGNTLVIVEHDRDVIENAQSIVEIGPRSGIYGGELVFNGSMSEFLKDKNSITAKYLKKDSVEVQNASEYQEASHFIELKGCVGNNLKAVDLKIPINRFSVITGVSGSGKSSLIRNTLYPAVARELEKDFDSCLGFNEIDGVEYLKDVISIDQKAVGRSGRSNPASYIGIYDEVRKLFANTPEASDRGLKAGYFSLNVDGGRCPTCTGDGFIVVDMQFMDDVILECEDCGGARFKKDTLEIHFNGKNIEQVLKLTVDEAFDFFVEYPKIRRALNYLQEVGLGYIQLGQPANTLSGGESQRLKIAKELSRSKLESTLYILDEPTTGLHFQEVSLLVQVLHKLVEKGGTVIVIEHNLELIREANYIVDVGPDGGVEGGNIIYQGSLEGIKNIDKSFTAKYL